MSSSTFIIREEKAVDLYASKFEKIRDSLTKNMNLPHGISAELLIDAITESRLIMASNKAAEHKVPAVILPYYSFMGSGYTFALAYLYAKMATFYLSRYAKQVKDSIRLVMQYEEFVSAFKHCLIPGWETFDPKWGVSVIESNQFWGVLFTHIETLSVRWKREIKEENLLHSKDKLEYLSLIKDCLSKSLVQYKLLEVDVDFNFAYPPGRQEKLHKKNILMLSSFINLHFDNTDSHYQQLSAAVVKEDKKKKNKQKKRNKEREKEQKKSQESEDKASRYDNVPTDLDLENQNVAAEEIVELPSSSIAAAEIEVLNVSEEVVDQSQHTITQQQSLEGEEKYSEAKENDNLSSSVKFTTNKPSVYSFKDVGLFQPNKVDPKKEYTLSQKDIFEIARYAKKELFYAVSDYLVSCIFLSRAFPYRKISYMGLVSDILEISKSFMLFDEDRDGDFRGHYDRLYQSFNKNVANFSFDGKAIQHLSSCCTLRNAIDAKGVALIYWWAMANIFQRYPDEIKSFIVIPAVKLFLIGQIGINAYDTLANTIIPLFIDNVDKKVTAASGWFCVVQALYFEQNRIDEKEFTEKIMDLGLPMTPVMMNDFIFAAYESMAQQNRIGNCL